jgi:hypothetical protein
VLVVTFTMLGEVVLARELSRFGDSVRDFRPVWSEIKADFHRIEAEQFDSQGARSGNPWAPLSPNYAAWKAKVAPGQPTLRLSNQMWSQFALGKGMYASLEPMRMELSPLTQYPTFHQRGSPKTHLPQRKVIDLTEDDRMRWMKMIHEYVYTKAREARLA